MTKEEIQEKINDLESQVADLKKELEDRKYEHQFDGHLLVVRNTKNNQIRSYFRCIKCIESGTFYKLIGYSFIPNQNFLLSPFIFENRDTSNKAVTFCKSETSIEISFNPNDVLNDIQESIINVYEKMKKCIISDVETKLNIDEFISDFYE